MVIVDSTVWVDYFGNKKTTETDWLEPALSVRAVGTTSLILCEVLQGVRDDSQFERIRSYLSELVISTHEENLAVLAAQNYRLLRKRGITIRKTIDCLTATFCIVDSLLHHDRDFIPFEDHLGLEVIHP